MIEHKGSTLTMIVTIGMMVKKLNEVFQTAVYGSKTVDENHNYYTTTANGILEQCRYINITYAIKRMSLDE